MPLKDEDKRREYQRNYARLRRAGLTGNTRKNQTVKPARIDGDASRFATVRDYVGVLNTTITDGRGDAQSSMIQKGRVIGFLVNVALRALELSSIEERLAQLEATITREQWR